MYITVTGKIDSLTSLLRNLLLKTIKIRQKWWFTYKFKISKIIDWNLSYPLVKKSFNIYFFITVLFKKSKNFPLWKFNISVEFYYKLNCQSTKKLKFVFETLLYAHLQSTFLWKLACLCLILSDISQQWKEVTIYPIPKPVDWEYDLAKTRPITLLECAWSSS